MKWDATEPSQGQFTFGTADSQVAAAQKAGQVIRCHNLNWYSQLPSWVSNGNWNAQSMTSVIQSHISNVAGHFKGKCLHWDVVNEALNDDGTYRSDVFYQKLSDSCMFTLPSPLLFLTSH
jgi:endo-1,4-beta-xylanase